MRRFTSDQHFGHLRITELTGRPFPLGAVGVPAMNAELIKRHNEVTETDDEVYVLGDFALGTIAESLPLAGELKGELRLIWGNHDRGFSGYYRHSDQDKSTTWTTRYLDAGFTEARDTATLEIAGRTVHLSHFPYLGGGDSHDNQERYKEFRLLDKGGWLLHGHVHGAWRQKGRMINVGVDAWNGYPVSEGEIVELIEQGPRHLEPLPWT